MKNEKIMAGLYNSKFNNLKIIVYYGYDENGELVAWSDTSEKPNNVREVLSNVFQFRQSNYNDMMFLLDLANQIDEYTGEFAYSTRDIRIHRAALLIQSWNITGSNSELLIPNYENIKNIHPNILNLLLDKLEKELGLFDSEDQEVQKQVFDIMDQMGG